MFEKSGGRRAPRARVERGSSSCGLWNMSARLSTPLSGLWDVHRVAGCAVCGDDRCGPTQ